MLSSPLAGALSPLLGAGVAVGAAVGIGVAVGAADGVAVGIGVAVAEPALDFQATAKLEALRVVTRRPSAVLTGVRTSIFPAFTPLEIRWNTIKSFCLSTFGGYGRTTEMPSAGISDVESEVQLAPLSRLTRIRTS